MSTRSQRPAALRDGHALATLVDCRHDMQNGHHRVRRISVAPETGQAAFLAMHPDLPDRLGGKTCKGIQCGRISIGSLDLPRQ